MVVLGLEALEIWSLEGFLKAEKSPSKKTRSALSQISAVMAVRGGFWKPSLDVTKPKPLKRSRASIRLYPASRPPMDAAYQICLTEPEILSILAMLRMGQPSGVLGDVWRIAERTFSETKGGMLVRILHPEDPTGNPWEGFSKINVIKEIRVIRAQTLADSKEIADLLGKGERIPADVARHLLKKFPGKIVTADEWCTSFYTLTDSELISAARKGEIQGCKCGNCGRTANLVNHTAVWSCACGEVNDLNDGPLIEAPNFGPTAEQVRLRLADG